MNLDQLRRDLRQAEGVQSCLYDDATGARLIHGSTIQGYPTIGIGHRADLPLSPAAILYLLDEDIAAAMADLDRHLSWWRRQPEPVQRALVELTFSLGIMGLEGFHHLLAALQAGAYPAAADALGASRWRTQVHDTRALRVMAQLRSDTLAAD